MDHRAPSLLVVGLSILLGNSAHAATPAGRLTFADRVAAQEAIERVYYSHQLGATAPFEEVVPREALERKVRMTLLQSLALERFWNTPLTPDALRREVERISAASRFPERLAEIEHALGDDPFLVQETLGRQALAERLSRSFFAFDERIHTAARLRASDLADRLRTGDLDPERLGGSGMVVEYVRLMPGVEPQGGRFASRLDPRRATGQENPGPQRGERVELRAEQFRQLRAGLPERIFEVGRVEEEREAFVVRVLLAESSRSLRVAVLTVPKAGWDEWWPAASAALDENDIQVTRYAAPALPALKAEAGATATPEATCVGDNTWDSSSLAQIPEPRSSHSALWTGSVMVIWGGVGLAPFISTGGRYDPLLDVWTPTSNLNAPSARRGHSVVWTGTRMIVWGGTTASGKTNTGARYDPVADVWTSVSTVGAPEARTSHGAAWTGSRMVVWSGSSVSGTGLLTGGRYDPATDTWQPTSLIGPPEGREDASAVWTGSTVFFWGGVSSESLNTGGRYDPVADLWLPVDQAGAPPLGRYGHSSVWTGSQVIVWGGYKIPEGLFLNNGGTYDPVANSWTLPTVLNAPEGRYNHNAVWTGSDMVVWGGQFGNNTNSGGRYNLAMNSWTPTSTVNAPGPRTLHSGVWTGNRMVVWGGADGFNFNNGGRYDPATNSWTPTSVGAGPSERARHSGTWTGSLMVIWGGDNQAPGFLGDGSRYDPTTDTWAAMTNVNAPPARESPTEVWTGSEVIVWGGFGGLDQNTGGRYNPITDVWTQTTLTGAPGPRFGHTAVWTGSLMVVWGGFHGDYLDDGARYNPSNNTWTPVTMTGVPAARYVHTAIWTGTRMIIWGGAGRISLLSDGYRYDPTGNSWTPISGTNAPAARFYQMGGWTGSKMFIWGGRDNDDSLNTGGLYDPGADNWSATTNVGAPTGRYFNPVVWTGSHMVVWGGFNHLTGNTDTGGRYDPVANTWTPTATFDAPSIRNDHTGVWAGNRMVIWGGINEGLFLNTGGRYAVGPFADGDLDGAPDFCDNCPGLSNPDQSDDDVDQLGDLCDNCPSAANPGQANSDADPFGDACDCAPSNSTVFAVPPEITGMSVLADDVTLSWTSAAAQAGSSTVYDLARGEVGQLPLGTGAAETCVAPGTSSTSAVDVTTPAIKKAAWYLARGTNACGDGSYGTASNGTPRTLAICP
jgi:N-acetylneuraminic acid mutarotase